MEKLDETKIIYDWNLADKVTPRLTLKPVEFDDETLRDGIQSPSVRDPDIGEKIKILHLMDSLGMTTADIGLPASNQKAEDDVLRLAQEIAGSRLKIKPNCAARTLAADVVPIAEISQKVGIGIEVYTFIGSSPIRLFAENWDVERLLANSTEAINFAVKEALPVSFVTEDTTRSRPDVLGRLFRNAIEHGARRLTLCDTVGHCTPDGAKSLITFTRNLIMSTGEDIKIDWHGHNDRGLALPLSIFAVECGADRIHGCALGIGERVGNAPMDQIMCNLKLLGAIDNDLSKLLEYCETVSKAVGVPIPPNYPVAGRDAFRTATGVHAAAIIKAQKKGDTWLADRIYSGVPAGLFGRRQEMEIGPMSGLSNVTYWLQSRGIEPETNLCQAIFSKAKASDHILEESEVLATIEDYRNMSEEDDAI